MRAYGLFRNWQEDHLERRVAREGGRHKIPKIEHTLRKRARREAHTVIQQGLEEIKIAQREDDLEFAALILDEQEDEMKETGYSVDHKGSVVPMVDDTYDGYDPWDDDDESYHRQLMDELAAEREEEDRRDEEVRRKQRSEKRKPRFTYEREEE